MSSLFDCNRCFDTGKVVTTVGGEFETKPCKDCTGTD